MTPHNQHFIESRTNSSRTIKSININTYSNQQSLQLSSKKLAREPNDNSSYDKFHSPIAYSKQQPTITNTTRFNAYTHINKTKRTLTFDKTIAPKKKTMTQTKIHLLKTKQDSLKAFSLRAKIPTKSHHIPQLPIDKTTQITIHQIIFFNTNESKGYKLITLNPNHIRIFYKNINGLELDKGGH